MVSIIAIILYIAYTKDMRRTCDSPSGCMVHDLALLGDVRLAEESDHRSDLKCTICLCDVEAGQKLRELYLCKHVFHQKCIDQWLLGTPVYSVTCPLCRGNLFESNYSPRRVVDSA